MDLSDSVLAALCASVVRHLRTVDLRTSPGRATNWKAKSGAAAWVWSTRRAIASSTGASRSK